MSEVKIPFPILATDYILEQVAEYGNFNRWHVMQNFKFDATKTDIDIAGFESSKGIRFENVIGWAMGKGYILKWGEDQDSYYLTDLGREVKRKGGHNKYSQFIEKRDNAVFESLELTKQILKATEDTATATENSSRYTKQSTSLLRIYTIITLVIAVTAIATCYYQKQTPNDTTNKTK